MSLNSDILNRLIKNQVDAIKYQTVFAAIVILVGLCILIACNFFIHPSNSNETLKIILNLGGGLISTISAYPINQIIARKEKLETYKTFKLSMPGMSDAEKARVEDILWKSVEKTV